ncbi:hypothetical protein LTS18_013529 [Coniosporium uncinatum]|uniref:Uncharacterized protein n=1 Tax=Coniosporium uncinatum TaxID=93489 RepID=A0ACC3D935_9PEZI|nr:hypothetical protein LTS18_013529 [Coniosporium uncinatum]
MTEGPFNIYPQLGAVKVSNSKSALSEFSLYPQHHAFNGPIYAPPPVNIRDIIRTDLRIDCAVSGDVRVLTSAHDGHPYKAPPTDWQLAQTSHLSQLVGSSNAFENGWAAQLLSILGVEPQAEIPLCEVVVIGRNNGVLRLDSEGHYVPDRGLADLTDDFEGWFHDPGQGLPSPPSSTSPSRVPLNSSTYKRSPHVPISRRLTPPGSPPSDSTSRVVDDNEHVPTPAIAWMSDPAVDDPQLRWHDETVKPVGSSLVSDITIVSGPFVRVSSDVKGQDGISEQLKDGLLAELTRIRGYGEMTSEASRVAFMRVVADLYVKKVEWIQNIPAVHLVDPASISQHEVCSHPNPWNLPSASIAQELANTVMAQQQQLKLTYLRQHPEPGAGWSIEPDEEQNPDNFSIDEFNDFLAAENGEALDGLGCLICNLGKQQSMSVYAICADCHRRRNATYEEKKWNRIWRIDCWRYVQPTTSAFEDTEPPEHDADSLAVILAPIPDPYPARVFSLSVHRVSPAMGVIQRPRMKPLTGTTPLRRPLKAAYRRDMYSFTTPPQKIIGSFEATPSTQPQYEFAYMASNDDFLDHIGHRAMEDPFVDIHPTTTTNNLVHQTSGLYTQATGPLQAPLQIADSEIAAFQIITQDTDLRVAQRYLEQYAGDGPEAAAAYLVARDDGWEWSG